MGYRSSSGRCAASRHPAEDHPQVLIMPPPMSSEAEPSNGVRRVYPGACLHEPPAAHKLVEGAGQLLLWINPSLKRKRDSRGCRGDNAALPVAGTVGLVFRATDACRAYARSGQRPCAKQGLVASVRSGVPTSPCGEVEEETALKPTPSLARHALSGLAGWLVLSGACRAQHYAGADTPSAVLSARRVEVGGAFERSVSRPASLPLSQAAFGSSGGTVGARTNRSAFRT
jgi:hypothetical protein